MAPCYQATWLPGAVKKDNKRFIGTCSWGKASWSLIIQGQRAHLSDWWCLIHLIWWHCCFLLWSCGSSLLYFNVYSENTSFCACSQNPNCVSLWLGTLKSLHCVDMMWFPTKGDGNQSLFGKTSQFLILVVDVYTTKRGECIIDCHVHWFDFELISDAFLWVFCSRTTCALLEHRVE